MWFDTETADVLLKRLHHTMRPTQRSRGLQLLGFRPQVSKSTSGPRPVTMTPANSTSYVFASTASLSQCRLSFLPIHMHSSPGHILSSLACAVFPSRTEAVSTILSPIPIGIPNLQRCGWSSATLGSNVHALTAVRNHWRQNNGNMVALHFVAFAVATRFPVRWPTSSCAHVELYRGSHTHPN